MRPQSGVWLIMQRSNFGLWIFAVCLMPLLIASNSHAQQIYKWVDANGRTHYSEKKDDAGNARTEELKLKSQPSSPQEDNSSAEYWQEQERKFRQRRVQTPTESSYKPPVATRPRSLSGGRENGTDASRCALAQDVLSGAVRHRNGAPTDAHDREVAQNDVRAFCH
jgi:hypothetical protein